MYAAVPIFPESTEITATVEEAVQHYQTSGEWEILSVSTQLIPEVFMAGESIDYIFTVSASGLFQLKSCKSESGLE